MSPRYRSRFVFSAAFAAATALAGFAFAQGVGGEHPFTLVRTFPEPVLKAQPWIRPKAGQALRVNQDALLATLALAPMIDTPEAAANPLQFDIPMPDGSMARFAVFESPILEPELAAKMPDFRSYAGQGIDDPNATVRFDFSDSGFHAFIRSPQGDVFIDPFSRGDTVDHMSYYKKDLNPIPNWACELTEGQNIPDEPVAEPRGGASLVVRRVYRIAIAATGEYTAYFGGATQAGNAIATAVNRINEVYIPDLAIQFNLIGNNNLIVFTNAATDPYPEPDTTRTPPQTRADVLLAANQAAIDSRIGAGNYDIGHVFDARGAGLAYVGVVCSANKAGGATGRTNPTGDAFLIDYVCHEIGHQCGANHTFNNNADGSCSGNREAGHAYEPGSGSTIM